MYYKKGYKYILTRDEICQTEIRPEEDIITDFIQLTTTGRLILDKGFAWDGATGAKDTKTNLRGSAIHDALIQLFRTGFLPKNLSTKLAIDLEYYKACRTDGMFLPRAVTHLAVIQFNRWDKHEEPEEQCAP